MPLKEAVRRYLCLENYQEDDQDENENNNQDNIEENEANNREYGQDNQSNEENENEEPLPKEQQRIPKRNIRQPVRYQDYYIEADREYEEGGGELLIYVEVMGSPDKNLWKKVIEEEKKSLEKNNTWEASKPEEIRRKEVITSRRILKIKDDGRYI